MKDLITKEIQNRADELRKEEAYRLGKMEGYQAGIDEAVMIIEKQKKELDGEPLEDWSEDIAYNQALDNTIKALQDNK